MLAETLGLIDPAKTKGLVFQRDDARRSGYYSYQGVGPAASSFIEFRGADRGRKKALMVVALGGGNRPADSPHGTAPLPSTERPDSPRS